MKTLTLVHGAPERTAHLLHHAGLIDRFAGEIGPEHTLRRLDRCAGAGRSVFAAIATPSAVPTAREWSRGRRYGLRHICLGPRPPGLHDGEPVSPDPDPDGRAKRQTLRARLLDGLAPAAVDFDRFSQVVVIGDIHGCDATLAAFLDNGPARSDTGYVFLGDYIAKGPSSAAVLRRLMDGYAGRDNVVMMAGNHETPLEAWVRGGRVRSRAFLDTVLPDFRAAGLDVAEAAAFTDPLVEARWIRWRGYSILASHGGFDRVPASLALLDSRTCRLGRPSNARDIDAAWARNASGAEADTLIQVHGHHNPARRPVAAAPGAFNLEGGVEAGGALRALVMTDTGGRCCFRTAQVPARDPISAFMRARAQRAAA